MCNINTGFEKAMSSGTDVCLLQCRNEGDQIDKSFVCESSSLLRSNSGHVEGEGREREPKHTARKGRGDGRSIHQTLRLQKQIGLVV